MLAWEIMSQHAQDSELDAEHFDGEPFKAIMVEPKQCWSTQGF